MSKVGKVLSILALSGGSLAVAGHSQAVQRCEVVTVCEYGTYPCYQDVNGLVYWCYGTHDCRDELACYDDGTVEV